MTLADADTPCDHESAPAGDQCGGTLDLRTKLIGCHREMGHPGGCCFRWYFHDHKKEPPR